MQMSSGRNYIWDDKSEFGCEVAESEDEIDTEKRPRGKANDTTKRPRRLVRSSPRQWAGTISSETCLDKDIVLAVTRALLAELTARVMLGEAVLLPVGVLEPMKPNRQFCNVVTGKLEDQPVVLRLRTTQQFRKRYRKSLKKFGY